MFPIDGLVDDTPVSSEIAGFTTFLGRYGKGMASPYRTFDVPAAAAWVVIEFDFYESDSWKVNSSDKAYAWMGGTKISLGSITNDVMYTILKGSNANVEKHSLGAPAHLGFNPNATDQKHHVKLELAKATGMYDNGKFRLKLEVDTDGVLANESGGWDNFKISIKSDCGN